MGWLLSTAGALLTASAPTPAWAYVGFALLGLGISLIGPMGLSLVGKLVAPQFRTKAISRAAIVGFSVYFLAPVLIGTISQVAGLRTVFAFLAVVLLCLVPLSLILGRLRMRMAAG